MLWEIKPTSPNPRNRLGDKPGVARSEALMTDGLARADVWWAGTLSVITMGFLSSPQASSSPVPHWLSTTGLIIFPECHLDLLTLPCTSSRSYVLNSPIEWAHEKVLGIPLSLCLDFPGKYPKGYFFSRLSLWASCPWKWTALNFYFL